MAGRHRMQQFPGRLCRSSLGLAEASPSDVPHRRDERQESELASARRLNHVLKHLRCLRCGKMILTTRGCRICRRCSAINAVFGRYAEAHHLGKDELKKLPSRLRGPDAPDRDY